MTDVRYYAVVHFLRGITQEHGPYATREEAEAAGESEQEGHRHRPLWYVVEERHEYLDWELVGCIVDE